MAATANVPTEQERQVVDQLLGPAATGWEGGPRGDLDLRVAHALPRRRHLLLPLLRALQQEVGAITPGAVAYLSQRLGVAPADVYGVASFYALLEVGSPRRVVVHVCQDVACALKGAAQVEEAFRRAMGPEGAGPGVTWRQSSCLGLCGRAPAVYLQRRGAPDQVVAPVEDAPTLAQALARHEEPTLPPPLPEVPQAGREGLWLLRRAGAMEVGDIDAYLASGGYRGLRRALALGPEGVLREMERSGLSGRGGAGFPTGRKWEAVARQARGPHYVVANADESEPGTFKDRILLERDPFLLLEGLTIAGWAVGARDGYIFLRGEYPLARRRLEEALACAYRRGYLGTNVLGQGWDFDVHLRVGAGAYVCGEETALLEAVEGRRGEPRLRPPYPTDRGLFGAPTVVNNVETLANVPLLLAEGVEAFSRLGTPQAPGTRLFSVSGAVRRPGVYEYPLGTSLRTVLEEAGAPPPQGIQAVLVGGASGAFLGPGDVDIPLTPLALAARGATLGSGAIVVFPRGADMGSVVLRIARFFRDESCGQCVPCRVGTVRQVELVRRLLAGAVRGSWTQELALLEELSQAMMDASICGLGQTATSAVRSALRLGLLGGEVAG